MENLRPGIKTQIYILPRSPIDLWTHDSLKHAELDYSKMRNEYPLHFAMAAQRVVGKSRIDIVHFDLSGKGGNWGTRD